jgi:FkbM family methyltransferase
MNYSDKLIFLEDRWHWRSDDTDLKCFKGWKEENQLLNVLSKYLDKKDVMVQAGGNCGMQVDKFAKEFGMVYTFEPDPINFHCLVNNCQKDNIFKLNAALGNKHAMICMNDPVKDLTTLTDNSGMNSVAVDQSGNTPQLMIDDLELNHCNLIWLDIEGYEIRALMGAENTIDKFKPVIMAERASEEVRQYLSAWNYMQIDTSNLDCVFKVQ